MANSGQISEKELTTDTLHKAARLEQVGEVREFFRAAVDKEIVQHNPHGYTPLHSAAMAINPNAEIASILVKSAHGTEWLNAQTEKDRGSLTALHVAVANVNVTLMFIEEFKMAHSLSRNALGDTPYHVAAKSSNQKTIIYMLNTFSPTNNEWDVDAVDEGNKCNFNEDPPRPKDTVINICARNGNAKAVSLLIKHGVDISHGVLHEIVLESVRSPDKIDKLLRVYQTIVDNVVTWHALEEKPDFLDVEGSDNYAELFRKIMVWLLTNRLEKYGERNVIECALEHGASEMFWHIINTKSVFRTDGEETHNWLAEKNESKMENSKKKDSKVVKNGHMANSKIKDSGKHGHKTNLSNQYWTVFDVTNFTQETKPRKKASSEDRLRCTLESTPLCLDNATAEDEDKHVREDREQNKVENKEESKRDFDELPELCDPYLSHLLLAFDQWKGSNVLSAQPLKTLAEPYIQLVQRFYFILGLLQLMFMISFTVFHMPTTCSLALMFNVSNTLCNNNSDNDHLVNSIQSTFRHQRSWRAVVWLIWPIILVAILAFFAIHNVKQMREATRKLTRKIVVKTKDLRQPFLRKLLGTILRLLTPAAFCLVMFAWLCIYQMSETYEYYVDVTGMVLLTGWAANLYFFGAVTKNFSIFSLVVSKIVLKDIPSFMLFFGFTVGAFTFAMHTLCVSVCSPNEVMEQTFFSVLSNAFGIGDFFEMTMTDSTCAGASMHYLFEIVYFLYMWATMIILLNVLIAMLNNRYEKAKRKAENVWSFQMLSAMRAVEHHKKIAKVLKKCLLPGRHNAYLFFNKHLNRWYLRVVLPVDQQIK